MTLRNESDTFKKEKLVQTILISQNYLPFAMEVLFNNF